MSTQDIANTDVLLQVATTQTVKDILRVAVVHRFSGTLSVLHVVG